MADTIQESVPTKPCRIAVNFSWLLVGEASAKLLAFFITVYLTRVLGSGKFGMLSFATAFATYGALLTDFGLSKYGTREIARNPDNLKLWVRNIQSTRLMLSIVLFVLASTLAWFLIDNHEMRLLIIFSFIWIFPYALGLDWVYRGFQKMGYSALWSFLQQAVFLVLILVLVTGKDNLVLVPVCKVAGCLLASMVLLFNIGKITGSKVFIPVFDLKVFKRVLMAGAPLAASYLMVQIYWNVDTIILGIVDKPEVVGIYSAAYKVVLLAASACFTITNAFYTQLSQDFVNNFPAYRKNLARMMSIVVASGVVISISVFLLRDWIVLTLYGNEYREAAFALSILAFAILGDYIASGFGIMYVSAGFEKRAFFAVMLGAATNVGLNILLIPRFSFMGAAITTLASYAVIIIFFIVNLKVVLKRNQHVSV